MYPNRVVQSKYQGIERFSLHLSAKQNFINNYFSHHGFLSRLRDFWNLRKALIDTGKTGNIILWRLDAKDGSQNDFSAVGDSIKRASQVTNTTNFIINSIHSQEPISILSIASILLTFIIRVEAHEYEIKNMIDNAKKYINPFNYDIEETLSVNSKVQKGKVMRYLMPISQLIEEMGIT